MIFLSSIFGVHCIIDKMFIFHMSLHNNYIIIIITVRVYFY